MKLHTYPGSTHSSHSNKGAGFESSEQEERDFPARLEGQCYDRNCAQITRPAFCCRTPCLVPSPRGRICFVTVSEKTSQDNEL